MAEAKRKRGRGFNRLRLTLFAIFITLFWAAIYVWQPPVVAPFLDSLEKRLVDLRLQLRGPTKATTPVVIAALDEKSVDEVGRWPWPRPVTARFLESLGNSGAAVVGLDMGFFEPDADLAVKYLEEERKAMGDDSPGTKELVARVAQRLGGDELLGRAVALSNCPMVLGYFLYMTPRDVAHLSKEELDRRRSVPAGARYLYVTLEPGTDEKYLPVPLAYMVEPNIPQLQKASRQRGFFNVLPDHDGTFRTVPLVIRMYIGEMGGKPQYDYFMPLFMNMLTAYRGREVWEQEHQVNLAELGLADAVAQGRVPPGQVEEVKAAIRQARGQLRSAWAEFEPKLKLGPYGVVDINLGKTVLSPEPNGSLRLNFHGPKGSFEYYSWVDIMEGRLPPDALKDKLVVVGSSAVGVGDVRPTPFDPQLPGPAIHATALDNLLTGTWLLRPDWAQGADLMAILLLGLVGALVMPRLSAVPALGLFVGMLALLVGWNHFFAFQRHRWELSLIYPMITLSMVFITVTALRFVAEEGEKRKVRRAFNFYLSPEVIERVLEDPSRLALGGQRRELSIFFSDLEGFTSISEKLDAEDLTTLLNDYLSDMTDLILDSGGTLDKYEGDAIICFWNAPLDMEDHALTACRISLECQAKLAERREEFRQKTGAVLKMRIGVNTGIVVVGNMGSSRRFDYTMLGDAANLAARLEGANKVFGTYLMVSQYTWEQTKGQIIGRELGALRVKGKQEAVHVYEPMGTDPAQVDMALIETFTKGLELCRQKKWPEALETFRSLPDDSASHTYIKRLEELIDGTMEDWDAVWSLTSK